jgi:hypothetical protein
MKFKNAGRKPQYEPETVLQEIKIIDPNKRRSVRSLAGALGISKSSFGSVKKEKKLRVYTMSLKPKLKDDHYLNCLYHCISKIDRNTINGVTRLKYKTFYNEVHVDEKWFFLVQYGGRYYLTADEVVPPRTISVQHKSHITKVMFLCALARPRYNNTTRQWFDGLIGIYPVGEFDMYKHGSLYHTRGDLKWTNFALDREEYQRIMVEFVLPDIKRKMPFNNNIFKKTEIYLYLGYIIEGNYCLPFRHFACKGLSPQPITAAPYTGQIEAVDHCPGCIAPTYMSPP